VFATPFKFCVFILHLFLRVSLLNSYFKNETFSSTRFSFFFAEDCTDLCALPDAGPGKQIKNIIQRKQKAHFRDNPDIWTRGGTDGGLTASDRRILFAKWTAEAWEEFFAGSGQEQVTNAFQRCGILLACDGSEDHLIKIQGYEGPYDLEVELEESEHQQNRKKRKQKQKELKPPKKKRKKQQLEGNLTEVFTFHQ